MALTRTGTPVTHHIFDQSPSQRYGSYWRYVVRDPRFPKASITGRTDMAKIDFGHPVEKCVAGSIILDGRWQAGSGCVMVPGTSVLNRRGLDPWPTDCCGSWRRAFVGRVASVLFTCRSAHVLAAALIGAITINASFGM